MIKNNLIILILLLISKVSFAQFYVVQDPDGFVNVRSEPNAKSKVLTTLSNGKVVYIYEPEGFTPVEFKENQDTLQAFIYRDRLKAVESFTKVKRKSLKSNEVTFEHKGYRIYLSTKAFEPEKHSFQFHKESQQIATIDHKPYWGQDGGMPKKQYHLIHITNKKVLFPIPDEALQGLYEPNLENTSVYYNPQTETFYIQSTNGDGAGGYLVIWVIEKGKYKERLVVHGF
jgi:hypothetical protein